MSIEVVRHVSADSAGVALLLSDPSFDLDATVSWQVGVPRRWGAGFIASIEGKAWPAHDAAGTISVEPVRGWGCQVRLVLTTLQRPDATMATAAKDYLSRLAVQAQLRASVA
jgi:hypothetical protein